MNPNHVSGSPSNDDAYEDWTDPDFPDDLDMDSTSDSQLAADLAEAEAILADDSFASRDTDTDVWGDEEAMYEAQDLVPSTRGPIRSYADMDFLRDAHAITMMPEVVMGRYLQYVFEHSAVIEALARENTIPLLIDDMLFVIHNMQDHGDLERVREFFVNFDDGQTFYPEISKQVLRQYRSNIINAIDAAKRGSNPVEGGAKKKKTSARKTKKARRGRRRKTARRRRRG